LPLKTFNFPYAKLHKVTAGLSALGNTRFVIYGGFAELIAGAISMGVGGYLGAKSEQ
jgi:VIT1/CCC1 family predicted Fe2+/Mn2+ transporter